MRLPARTHIYAARLLAGFVPIALLAAASVNGKQPAAAPVAPTVPAPIQVVQGHTAKKQNPLPQPAPLQPGSDKPVDKDKNGNHEKYPDVGPELTLGECIAIALERQPSLKALQASTAAAEAGYKALSNFGTVSTVFSPDLEIRKQQAKRG